MKKQTPNPVQTLFLINRIHILVQYLALPQTLHFEGTGVYVARVGRQSKTREVKDLEAHFTANLGYSHHQKAVILDAPVLGGHGRQPDQVHYWDVHIS